MKRLGQCLTRLRSEGGYSLREAATKAGLSPSYLSKIESGDAFATISIETLTNVAKAYEIPLLSILTDAGFVDEGEHKLPELPQYLRLKFSFSHQAIRDMEMAREIVERKYGKRN